ncbi:hypothetical protein CRYUN_Cryun04dG0011900 [Craigia yunnanensis]
MALLSKILDGADMKQLTITETLNPEPFPSGVSGGALKVKDEQGSLWMFNYRVRSGNKRVLSGHHWLQFLRNNGVQVGNRVSIHRNDDWCSAAEYKIEVIKK